MSLGDATASTSGAPRAGDIVTLLHAADVPSLVELAPVVGALRQRRAFRQVVACAGEVIDDEDLPPVSHRIVAPEGSRVGRIACLLTGFERAMTEAGAGAVVVAGDGEAALAAALCATKLGIPLIRVGAGLRSWDWRSAREVHRAVIDRLADTLLSPGTSEAAHLRSEGVVEGRIVTVGSPRVDLVRRLEVRARRLRAWRSHRLAEREYVFVVLRGEEEPCPAERGTALLAGVARLAARAPVALAAAPVAVPPDSRDRLRGARVVVCPPGRYVVALSLLAGAGALVTDDEALLEDAAVLGVPCFALTDAVARTDLLMHGTTVLLGDDPAAIADVRPVAGPGATHPSPPLPGSDGRAGERAAAAVAAHYSLAATVLAGL